MSDVVLIEERATAGGQRIGLATLNAPASLNALSLAMVQALTPAFREWARDPGVALVVLQGSGEKAFCAGGDLRDLYQSIRDSGAAPNAYAQSFFEQEYRLDHAIHTYPKPILCWGTGIVMGGGMGLMSGCSHRVVTPTSRLAMPEVSIGLYPDVGGSWFLQRMPGRVGLFLALTAAPMNAADALFCGLADLHIDAGQRDAALQSLLDERWDAEPRENRARLGELLRAQAAPLQAPSRVREHFDVIQSVTQGDDLGAIAGRLRAVQSDDPWLQQAVATFAKGSPSSIALIFEIWRRARHLSLAEVFRLEFNASLGCCAHPDFAEGIRALLIDKDRNPRWSPAALDAVTPGWVQEHLEPRFALPHPLATLG